MLERKMPLTDQNPGVQFFSLILIILLSMFFFNLFAIVAAIPIWGMKVINNISELTELLNPESIRFMKFIQVVNQFALFIFGPIFFAFLVERNWINYFKLNKKPKLNLLLLSSLSIFAILPFVSWIGDINQGMSMPSYLSGLEDWMKSAEDNASRTMLAFLNVKSIWAMIFNVIMIALIPGIGEELLFRGIILKLFKKLTKNTHLAVLFSAILFSALHMQFYGFLPRLGLGLLLGYIFVYTGSLWIPIFIHFLNNAAAIIFVYASNSTEILTTDIESFGSTNSIVIAMISLIVVTVIILYLRSKHLETKVITSE